MGLLDFFKTGGEKSGCVRLVTLDGQYNAYAEALHFKDGAESQVGDNRYRYVSIDWEEKEPGEMVAQLKVGRYVYRLPLVDEKQVTEFVRAMRAATSNTKAFSEGFVPVANEILRTMELAPVKLYRTPDLKTFEESESRPEPW